MAQFSVNPQRFDPYKNFKFRVKWDGRYVAGISKVSALKRTTEVVEHREGGDPSTGRKSPGRNKFEPITLERGVTHDLEFERWANRVWNFGAGLGAEVSLQNFRKDIIIEFYNEAGQLASIARCCFIPSPRPRVTRMVLPTGIWGNATRPCSGCVNRCSAMHWARASIARSAASDSNSA
jgi:phage tail-like protein